MPVRTIGTEITLEGETEFSKGMREMDSALGVLNAQLSANREAFADAADSEEALTKKSDLLNQKVEQQRAKLDALRSMLSDVEENYSDNTAELDKYRRKVAQAEAALSKTERELGKTEEALEDVRRPTDRAAEAFEKLRASVVSAAPALGSVGETVGLLGKGFGGIAAAGAAGSAAIAGVGLAAAGGAIALANMAKAAAEEGNPAFAGLASNLELLNGASSKAKAALGQILLPTLEDLSGEGAALLRAFSLEMNAAAGDVDGTSAVISKYVVKAARLLADAAPEMMKQGYELIAALGEGAADSLPILLDAAGGIIDTLTSSILSDPDKVSETASELVSSLVTFLGEHGPQLLSAGPVLIAALLQGIADGLGSLDAGGSSMISELVLSLLRGLPDMTSSGFDLLFAVLNGLLSAVPDLIAEIPFIILELVGAFLAHVPEFLKVGVGAVEAIIQGIFNSEDSIVQRIGSWIGGIVSRLASAAVNALGLAPGGGDTGGGGGRHATGLDYVPYDEYRAVLHKGERVLTAAENKRYSEGGSGPSKTVNVTINAPHIGPAEEQHLIDRINREFGGK